mgnify:CR=1 FL=1
MPTWTTEELAQGAEQGTLTRDEAEMYASRMANDKLLFPRSVWVSPYPIDDSEFIDLPDEDPQ